MRAAMAESSLNYSNLSDAYRKMKAASTLPSSKVKKVINLYFLDLLKSDFEVDE